MWSEDHLSPNAPQAYSSPVSRVQRKKRQTQALDSKPSPGWFVTAGIVACPDPENSEKHVT